MICGCLINNNNTDSNVGSTESNRGDIIDLRHTFYLSRVGLEMFDIKLA